MLNDEEKRKVRLLQNEYHKKWRKQNPEKVQAINDRFWRKKIQNLDNERSNNETNSN